MVAVVSMLDVLGYVLVVVAAFCFVALVTDVALAVMYARDYYSRHPELEPPDKRLVRIGLRGIR